MQLRLTTATLGVGKPLSGTPTYLTTIGHPTTVGGTTATVIVSPRSA